MPFLHANRTYALEKTKNYVENLPLENYYEDKKIKPGISFYKVPLDLDRPFSISSRSERTDSTTDLS